MNNNMPNNFNNNGLNQQGTMPNQVQPNNIPNKVFEQTQTNLVQGQSNIGNGQGVMQGMPNVNNGPKNIMEGQSNIVNIPGVVQGQTMQAPQANVNSQEVQIPGQINSGINAYTMQMEPKSNVNEQNNIQNNLNNGINNQSVMLNRINQAPEQINRVNIPNSNPQPINSNTGIQTSTMNNPLEMDNNAGLNNMTQMQNNQAQMRNNLANQNSLSDRPVNNVANQSTMNNIPNNNLNGQINRPNVIPNNNLNNNKTNNINGQVNRPNVIPNNDIKENDNIKMPAQNMQNNQANTGNNYSGPTGGIKPTPQSQGISQVGQTNLNQNPMSTDMSFEEPQQKKFPLSVREMVLLSIAFVGIVIVILQYVFNISLF